MKSCFCFLLVAGCAQPTSLQSTSATTGGAGHRDGGLVFDDGGSTQYEKPDLANSQPLPDLSELPDLAVLPDLAIPAGVDLATPAGADLATVPDLAHASVENCFNDIDDDGNGKINDGCPDTLSVGADVPLIAFGGSGGGAVSAHCPAGQVATAMRVYEDDYEAEMAGFGVGCSTLTLVRGASSYSVTVSAPAGLYEFKGSGWDYYQNGVCDTSKFQVVWNTLMNTNESGAYPYVHGLGMDCALGALTLSPTNQLSIAFTNLNTHFGYDYAWGAEHPQACGASQAVVGYNGRGGAWLDQIQPICAPIVVNYKP